MKLNPNRDYASQYWFEPLSKDYDCNQHPAPKRSLVKAFAAHTHLSQETAAHVLDRLRHLRYCLGEPDALTIRRLQPGTKQAPVARDATGGLIEDS